MRQVRPGNDDFAFFFEHVGFAVEVYNTKKNATVLVGKTSEARLSPTRVGHENENDFRESLE